MENFSFYSPTYFEFGKDAENKTGELVKRFGGSKVILHYGNGRDGKMGGFVTLTKWILPKSRQAVNMSAPYADTYMIPQSMME